MEELFEDVALTLFLTTLRTFYSDEVLDEDECEDGGDTVTPGGPSSSASVSAGSSPPRPRSKEKVWRVLS